MFHRVDAKSFVDRWKWFVDFPFDPGFLSLVRAGERLGIKVPLKVEVGWAKNWQEVK